MAAADFSGDGALDLAVANTQSNTISILLGAGDGTLENLKQYPLLEGAAIALTTGDFNGDGKPDLAVANQNCNGHCGPGPIPVRRARAGGPFQPDVGCPTV